MPEIAPEIATEVQDIAAGPPRPDFAFNASARPFKPLLQSAPSESSAGSSARLNPNATPFRPMLSELAEVPPEATVGGGVWNFAILNPSLLADGAAAAKKAVRKKDTEKAKPAVERSMQRTVPKAGPAAKSKPAAPAFSPASEGAKPPPVLPRWFPQETGAKPSRPISPKPDTAKAASKGTPNGVAKATPKRKPNSPPVAARPGDVAMPQEMPALTPSALSAIWEQLGASGFRPPWDADLAVQLEWLRLLSQTAQLQANGASTLLNGSAAASAAAAQVDFRPPIQPAAPSPTMPSKPDPSDDESGKALLKMLKAGDAPNGSAAQNWSGQYTQQDWWGQQDWWNTENWWDWAPATGATTETSAPDVETELQGRALLEILKPKTAAQPNNVQSGAGLLEMLKPKPSAGAAQGVPQPEVQTAVQQAAKHTALQATQKAAAKPAAQPAVQPAAQPAAPTAKPGEATPQKIRGFDFPVYTAEHADSPGGMLKAVDSRTRSGPQAGLVTDPDASRFLLMQLKGPETIAREDGKKLLNNLRKSIQREDERKANLFMKLIGGKGAAA
jgi:hypothetical protein